MEYHNKRRFLLGVTIFLFLFLFLYQESLMIRVFACIFGIYFFYFFDHLFNLKFEFKHYLHTMVILFFGIFLSPLYFLSPIYDKVLHLTLPILGSTLLFFAVSRIKIDFKWKLLMTFTSMIAILTIFELGEYALDLLFDLKLQGVYLRDMMGLEKFQLLMEKNDDTMIDLMFGIIGTFLYTAGKGMNYIYKKRKNKKS